MPRRRLRVVCSSDEEDQDQPPPPSPPPQQFQHQRVEDLDDYVIIEDIETDFQTVTLNSANPTPNTNSSTTNSSRSHTFQEPIPLEISDEDIEDATVDVITTNHSSYASTNGNSHSYFEALDSLVNGVLERLGLRLKREWLDSCLSGLQVSVRGFQGMDDSAKAKLCFQQLLVSDMNYCGAGVLPPNVQAMHLVDLKGPFVLQVDEIVNISCPLRGRYQNAAPGIKRCLKLSMTDGVQRVFGMEYRPIKDLETLAPAGMKIAVCNVNIRHGLLMLVPQVLEVLGGSVQELDAARQRLIAEINKPPRGKINRNGISPSLENRATLAAWPPNNIADPGNVDVIPSMNTPPIQADGHGVAPGIPVNERCRQTSPVPSSVNNMEPNRSSISQASGPGSVASAFGISDNGRRRQDFAVPASRNNVVEPLIFSAQRPQKSPHVPRHDDQPVTEGHTSVWATGQTTEPGIHVNCVPVEDVVEPLIFSAQRPQNSPPVARHDNQPVTVGNISVRETDQTMEPGIPVNLPVKDVTCPVAQSISEPNSSSAVDMDAEELFFVDEPEHAILFSRNKEIPFTYFVSLSAKLASTDDQGFVVRGKIKCIITAVKRFQFKQRTTYELLLYVDDGSLIAEILIDHNVVQNAIGYSPQEVTTALAASDSSRVSEMRDILKQFQLFLINFEGTMVVEMNKSSSVPVATEMNQGCSPSDASLLLKRLKSYNFACTQIHSHLNPINISP